MGYIKAIGSALGIIQLGWKIYSAYKRIFKKNKETEQQLQIDKKNQNIAGSEVENEQLKEASEYKEQKQETEKKPARERLRRRSKNL